MAGLKRLVVEIHRRSLWQVLGIYLAGSWLALQAADTLTASLGLPDWVPPFALVALIIGLPLVMATAFVQEGMRPRRPHGPPSPAVEAVPIAEPTQAPKAREKEHQVGAHHKIFTWRNALAGMVAAFTLLGLGTAGYLTMRTLGIGPAGTLVAKGILDERDPIMVAEFQSGSGDLVLARTATEAFRADLAQSQVVTVVEPRQAAAVLERMRRDPATPLDPDVAQEIAVREGIKAIVTGEVNSAGAGFLLTARVVSASDGSVLVSQSETARDLDAVIDAMGALSQGVRERLGESLRLIHASPRLSAVTTSSLEALEKYQEGIRAIDQAGDSDLGIALLEEAVAIDSTFAYAWRKLGVQLRNRFRPRSQWAAALTKAFEHRDRLTDFERYRTMASYYDSVTGEREQAITAYENAIRVCPTCTGSRNNLALLYGEVEDYERAEELLREEMALDTTGILQHTNLVGTLVTQGNLAEADSVWALTHRRFPGASQIYAVGLRAVRGDWESAETLLADMVEPGDEQLYFRAAMAVIRGRLDEAEQLTRRNITNREASGVGHGYGVRGRMLARLDLELRGEPERGLKILENAMARKPIEQIAVLDRPYLFLARIFAREGQPERARSLIYAFESEVLPALGRSSTDGLIRARAAVALAEGRFEDAIAHQLQAEDGRCLGRCYHLARAYDLAGQRDSALVVYDRYATVPNVHGWWREDRFDLGPAYERLGQLYDEVGDLENSAKYYALFVELWVDADPVLQPRVQAAQTRLEEIMAERG